MWLYDVQIWVTTRGLDNANPMDSHLLHGDAYVLLGALLHENTILGGHSFPQCLTTYLHA